MQKVREKICKVNTVLNVKIPQDHTYFKILRFNLLLLNAWPGREIGENVSKFWALISMGHVVLHTLLIIGGFMYLRYNALDFFELVNVYLIQIMWIFVLFRLTLLSISKYKEVFSMFLTKMHLVYYKDSSRYAMKMYKRVHFISHVFTICIQVQAICVWVFFHAGPMLNNYFTGKYNQPISEDVPYDQIFYYSFPYDTTTTLPGYIFAFVLNLFESYLLTVWFCMIDLAISLIIFNIWGHFKILIHELYSFQLPCKLLQADSRVNEESLTENINLYSEGELNKVTKKLKHCIDYHRQIIEFTKHVSGAFGPMLFFYYIFYQVSLCLTMVECSQMTVEAMIAYGPLVYMMFQQLIQLSVIFELIGTKSQELKDAVYGIPWENMDIKNRKMVAIFLMNVQTPIYVKALGLAQIGVRTMARIIKTSLSYFMFLHTCST